jgi:hypothetical protein
MNEVRNWMRGASGGPGKKTGVTFTGGGAVAQLARNNRISENRDRDNRCIAFNSSS